MSALFSNAYLRPTNGVSAHGQTICGWARKPATGTGMLGFVGVSGSDLVGIEFYTTDQLAVSYNGGNSAVNFASSPTTGTPFFFALVETSSGVTAYWKYWGDATLQSASATYAMATPNIIQFGRYTGGSTPLSGSLWNLKAWNRTLSVDELIQESYVRNIRNKTNEYAHYKLNTAADLTNYSAGTAGNGVVTGTALTDSSESISLFDNLPIFDQVAPGASTITTGSTSLLSGSSVTPAGSNRFLIGAVGEIGSGSTGMKFGGSGGTALTRIGSELTQTPAGYTIALGGWGLIAPAVSANALYSTFGPASNEAAHIGVLYTGVNQTTPTGTPVTNTGNVSAASTVASATLTTAVGDTVVMLVWGIDQGSSTPSFTSLNGSIIRAQINSGLGGFDSLAIVEKIATTTSTTIEVTFAAGDSNTNPKRWNAIAFVVNPVITSTVAVNESGNNSMTVAVPAGGTTGDAYAIGFVTNSDPGTITPPSGFTQRWTSSEATFGSRIYTFTRDYDGSEGANFTFGFANYPKYAVEAVLVPGGAGKYLLANSLSFYNGYISAGNPNAGNTGAVEVTAAGQRIVTFFGTSNATGAQTVTVSHPVVPGVGSINGGQGRFIAAGYREETGAGFPDIYFNAYSSVSTDQTAHGAILLFDSVDTTPNAFSFTDQTNVALSTLTESNAITVSGITAAATISVTGGEYQINAGSWTSTSGTINNGDSVKVRHTSSASNDTATNTVLDIGGVSDTFTTTTLALAVPNRAYGSFGAGPFGGGAFGAAYVFAPASSGTTINQAYTEQYEAVISALTAAVAVSALLRDTPDTTVSQAGAAVVASESFAEQPDVVASTTTAVSNVTADEAFVEQPDRAVAAATEAVVATESFSDSQDHPTGAASAPAAAAEIVNEASDLLSVTTTEAASASEAFVERADAATATTAELVAADENFVEQSDTAVGSGGTPAATADQAFSESRDTHAITAVEAVAASEAFTEQSDVVALAATEAIAASEAFTEQTERTASSLTESVAASEAFTDEPDRAASTAGAVAVVADETFTEASDAVSTAASETVAVSEVFAEQADLQLAASAVPAIASEALSEQYDRAVAAAVEAVAASELFAEQNDSASGVSVVPVGATAAVTEQNDLVSVVAVEAVAVVGQVIEVRDLLVSVTAIAAAASLVLVDERDRAVSTAGSVASADLNVNYTDQNDQSPSTATGAVAASAALTDAQDNSSGAASVPAAAQAAIYEVHDALTTSLGLLVSATVALLEAADRAASTAGASVTQADAFVVDQPDALLGAGATLTVATLALIEETEHAASLLAAEVAASVLILETDDVAKVLAQLGLPGFVDTVIGAQAVVKQAVEAVTRVRHQIDATTEAKPSLSAQSRSLVP